jgi:hypothetical protein
LVLTTSRTAYGAGHLVKGLTQYQPFASGGKEKYFHGPQFVAGSTKADRRHEHLATVWWSSPTKPDNLYAAS